MSDDGLVNLEDDGPAPEPAAPVAEPAPAEVAAPPAPEEELEAVELNGQRVVPVSVLKAIREEQKALKEKAARTDELEAKLREIEPYAQFVQNNRELLVQRVQPDAPKPAPVPDADPDAMEAARLMDFYKPDGSLDADKGSRWLALQDKRASKLADQRVAPILQRTAQEQAQVNFHKALQIKDANGESPSPESLRAVFGGLSDQPHLLADPQVAGVMAALALGIDRLQKPRAAKVAAPPPALASEPSGGVPQSRPTMSRFEESVAKESGISASKWQEHTKGYQAGRPSALED